MSFDARGHARRMLRELHEAVGLLGFHPDSDIAEYEPSFAGEEARLMQLALDFCREVLGDETYERCLERVAEARREAAREEQAEAERELAAKRAKEREQRRLVEFARRERKLQALRATITSLNEELREQGIDKDTLRVRGGDEQR